MSITKSEWLLEVREEIENIKKHATIRQIGKLDFDSFDASEPALCIYGQMTGNCFNMPAFKLIKKCCVRYHLEDGSCGYNFSRIKNYINGTKQKPLSECDRKYNDRIHNRHYSALEAYITFGEAKNEEVLAYIKGETETLEL